MIRYETRNWLSIVVRVRGTVLSRVALRALTCGALAWLLVYIQATRDVDLSIPVVVHSIVGVALGLLLVFRTNTSYDRYWEGRRNIGDLIGHCRDLARQTSSYLAKDPERRALAGRHIVAFYLAVKRSLRCEREHPELVDLLGDERAVTLERAEQVPLSLTAWLTEIYVAAADDGLITETRLRNLDTNLTSLSAFWADLDRIRTTPVPFAYAHHIKVFLSLFCFTVPFALADLSSWYAIGGAVLVAFALFGIDEIGVEIEDPFGYDPNDLPLDEIGAHLEAEVFSLTEGRKPSDPQP